MIRLGLRLTLGAGREALARLVLIVLAGAVGCALLLLTLAGTHAVASQNDRYAWLNTGTGSQTISDSPDAPLWWNIRADTFRGRVVGIVEVAATRAGAPVPPGLPRLPGPGEYYASPALAAALRTTPADQLADRYPGHLVGLIGDAALPSPDTMLLVAGDDPARLAARGARRVDRIGTATPDSCNGQYCLVAAGTDVNGMDLVLSVVLLGLLFPVLVFIGTATRLSAARREQRLAAMRLVGATPRQVAALSTVESTLAAVAGVAAGFGLFLAVRPAVAAYPFTGGRFFPTDLSLTPTDVAAVAVGVPVAAAVAARIALRRVRVSPLGVQRRVTPPPPRAWRLLPLLAGIGELAAVLAVGAPPTSQGQMAAYLPGFLLLLAGLVTGGPWLTAAVARVLAGRARRPSTLIAARRLADDPRAAYRAVSGLVLALFVTTVAVGIVTSIAAERDAPAGALGTDVLFSSYHDGRPPAGADLRSVAGARGVDAVVAMRADPTGTDIRVGDMVERDNLVVSCADLARMPGLGRCPTGAAAAVIPSWQGAWTRLRPPSWPMADIDAARLSHQPVQLVAVVTDGSAGARERARTALEALEPARGGPPETMREQIGRGDLGGWQQLAAVIVLASLVVAGCTLAVGVAGGIAERRRPFSLLRLTGTPLRTLRRVVALENAAPLLVVSAVAIAVALIASQLFLRAQLRYDLHSPGGMYYLSVGGGLALALAVIAAALPLLRRLTGPESARNG